MLTAPTCLFAVKLTTLSPNAIAPFAISSPNCVVERPPCEGGCPRDVPTIDWRNPAMMYSRTWFSSPEKCAMSIVWINASGERRWRRWSGVRHGRCGRGCIVGNFGAGNDFIGVVSPGVLGLEGVDRRGFEGP